MGTGAGEAEDGIAQIPVGDTMVLAEHQQTVLPQIPVGDIAERPVDGIA